MNLLLVRLGTRALERKGRINKLWDSVLCLASVFPKSVKDPREHALYLLVWKISLLLLDLQRCLLAQMVVKEENVLELLQVLNEGNWVVKASQRSLGRVLCHLGWQRRAAAPGAGDSIRRENNFLYCQQ